MNKILAGFIIIISLSLAGCKGNSDKQAPEQDTVVTRSVFSWESVINDSTGRLEMKKNENMGPDSLSNDAVITYLNKANPNIQLQIVRQSNDTIFIRIPDAEHLTQRMGSTGPTMYFANAVYNLTEIPGIKFVSFDFDEGDHASPATYNRENFRDE